MANLNGTKNWITHGISSDITVVVAEPVLPGRKIMPLPLWFPEVHRDSRGVKKKINWVCGLAKQQK